MDKVGVGVVCYSDYFGCITYQNFSIGSDFLRIKIWRKTFKIENPEDSTQKATRIYK